MTFADRWRRRLVLAGALITVLLLARGGHWAWAALSTDDPLAAQACQSCHLAGEETDALNASLLEGTPEKLCVRCHENALQASHPSGVSPSMAVPERLPVDWKGHVTCSTCHEIHQPSHGALKVSERGREFCMSCHPQQFFTAMADQGGSLVVSGHMQSGERLEQTATDEYSVQCMACHQERGELVGAVRLRGGLVEHASAGMEHPVGVDYDEAARFGGYRAPAELPESVLLPGGKVSCISCHQGYSREHGAPVMANKESRLCFQCHLL